MTARLARIFLLAFSLAAISSAVLPLPVLAQRGAEFTLYLALSRDTVEPGQDNVLFVDVRNTGETELTDIEFSYLAPEGWAVEFAPAVIGSLAPDALQTVEVGVRPPATAGRGQYQVTLIAEAGGVRRIANAWLRIETSTSVWLWIGIGVAVVVAAAFALIFMRANREWRSGGGGGPP